MTAQAPAAVADGTSPAALYDDALMAAARGQDPSLVASCGGVAFTLPLRRWVDPAAAADVDALDRLCTVLPPGAAVLDLGCGPGRHSAALLGRGARPLGVDTSPASVALTRRRGAPALRANALGPLPDPSHDGADGWLAVLLLDGNIGIGGDPLMLLCRVRDLLRPGGLVLLELDGDGVTDRAVLRLHDGRRSSADLPWARLGDSELAGHARLAGMRVLHRWSSGRRRFALLEAVPA